MHLLNSLGNEYSTTVQANHNPPQIIGSIKTEKQENAGVKKNRMLCLTLVALK